jgi:hypothetical protein
LFKINPLIFAIGVEMWPSFHKRSNNPFILPKENRISLDEIAVSHIFESWEHL